MAENYTYPVLTPYPLTIALERFHTPEGKKHSALIVYRDDGQVLTLPCWFNFYNGRQLIEAGIKESNVVFKMHPLKMRSQGGIANIKPASRAKVLF